MTPERRGPAQETRSHSGWLLTAVLVQAVIGASMVPMRYLQTVAGLPGLALVAVSDWAAFALMAWRMLPRIEKHHWRSKTLWVMVGIVVVRTVLLTFAVRFTKAYLVQLINLLAPFMVVLLDRLINRSEIPKLTLPAISLSLVGGVLMVFGGLIDGPLSFSLTAEDGLGLILAFLGTFGIAAYMMIVKHGEQVHLPFEAVYISQVAAMMILMTGLSLSIGEDWHAFSGMDWRAGLALIFNAIGVEIACKVGNITVLRKLGAPLISSMLAVRLVAALFLGWFILGEKLHSIWQWLGAFIVIITVTLYLSRQSSTMSSGIQMTD